MPSLPKLRRASAADATSIGELLGQLGYPASGPDVAERLVSLEAFVDAVVFVADLDGGVAGVVSGHLFPVLHQSHRAAYVTALVVGDAARRKGVGAMLVAAVEEWARQHGAARISVTSALHRDDAHAFYEALGWARTGVRLGKELGRGQAG
jgi:GNAT superfamily N-acetyltransferase